MWTSSSVWSTWSGDSTCYRAAFSCTCAHAYLCIHVLVTRLPSWPVVLRLENLLRLSPGLPPWSCLVRLEEIAPSCSPGCCHRSPNLTVGSILRAECFMQASRQTYLTPLHFALLQFTGVCSATSGRDLPPSEKLLPTSWVSWETAIMSWLTRLSSLWSRGQGHLLADMETEETLEPSSVKGLP